MVSWAMKFFFEKFIKHSGLPFYILNVHSLNDQYSTLREMKDDINHIVLPKELFFENKFDISDKIISVIYPTLIKFVRIR